MGQRFTKQYKERVDVLMEIFIQYKTLPPGYRLIRPTESLEMGTEFLLFYNDNNVNNRIYIVAGFVENQVVTRYSCPQGGWRYEIHPYGLWARGLRRNTYVKEEE